MHNLMKELFPICRSITGNGVRDTLKILQTHIPISVYEIPSETKVFDWKIPKEWNIHDAYVIDPKGKKIIDFKKSNLHVVSYSIPIHKKMSLSELKPHLHTIPEIPDAIPYRTSYYDEDWGFCMKYNDFQKLEDGEYEIMIDSSLENGFLTYGEFFKQGELKDEFLISCYICHPSMANNEVSGPSVLTYLANWIQKYQIFHVV